MPRTKTFEEPCLKAAIFNKAFQRLKRLLKFC